MESVIKHTYDALLGLRAPSSANITATAASSQVGLDKITHSVRGSLDGRFGEGSFDVVVHITTLDHTTGDETYSCAFQTYDSAGLNGVTHETRLFTVSDVGNTYVFKFDTRTLGIEDANAAFFGLNITLAGTTPILNYYAYVSPNNRY